MPPDCGVKNWVKAPSEQSRVVDLRSSTFSMPFAGGGSFLDLPRPGAHPFGALRRTATSKSAVLRICVGAKKYTEKAALLARANRRRRTKIFWKGVWGKPFAKKVPPRLSLTIIV